MDNLIQDQLTNGACLESDTKQLHLLLSFKLSPIDIAVQLKVQFTKGKSLETPRVPPASEDCERPRDVRRISSALVEVFERSLSLGPTDSDAPGGDD